MTNCAGTAQRKGHGHKELTVEKRGWKGAEYSNGIRNQDLKQQVCLGSKETFSEALGQTIRLEIIKLTAESFVRIRKMSVKASWRSQLPPKWKKRLLAALEP
jgi:hypothetical protein